MRTLRCRVAINGDRYALKPASAGFFMPAADKSYNPLAHIFAYIHTHYNHQCFSWVVIVGIFIRLETSGGCIEQQGADQDVVGARLGVRSC
jgi:hypothetical protein